MSSLADKAASLTHVLGRSKNTIDGDGPALKLFDYWWTKVYQQEGGLDSIKFKVIEEDNLRSLFMMYTYWLSNSAIPKNWEVDNNGNMIAPKSAKPEEPTVILAESTLVKYVGKTIAWLRRKFPNHPDFVDLDPKKPNDVPEWWTILKRKFSKDINDFQERLDSDYVFGCTLDLATTTLTSALPMLPPPKPKTLHHKLI